MDATAPRDALYFPSVWHHAVYQLRFPMCFDVCRSGKSGRGPPGWPAVLFSHVPKQTVASYSECDLTLHPLPAMQACTDSVKCKRATFQRSIIQL